MVPTFHKPKGIFALGLGKLLLTLIACLGALAEVVILPVDWLQFSTRSMCVVIVVAVSLRKDLLGDG